MTWQRQLIFALAELGHRFEPTGVRDQWRMEDPDAILECCAQYILLFRDGLKDEYWDWNRTDPETVALEISELITSNHQDEGA